MYVGKPVSADSEYAININKFLDMFDRGELIDSNLQNYIIEAFMVIETVKGKTLTCISTPDSENRDSTILWYVRVPCLDERGYKRGCRWFRCERNLDPEDPSYRESPETNFGYKQPTELSLRGQREIYIFDELLIK